MSNEINSKDDLDFEAMMSERMKDNFGADDNGKKKVDPRLKEMNKKLPNWNLEPPHTFLK